MPESVTTQAADLLALWLEKRLDPAAYRWLEERLALVSLANSDRDLFITLGMIPRKLGRQDLRPDKTELTAANDCKSGWDTSLWSVDTTARVLVLCRLAIKDPETFGETLREWSRTADVAESIAVYSGYPVFPADATLATQIGEGLRTNIRAVFESIAHHNPYPREHFDQNRWNHMVLKALFVESRLYPIQGLDQRANEELARILCDYAHERWAAHRAVTPELWRCVGPYATSDMLSDLQRVIDSDNLLEQRAGILAASSSPVTEVRQLCERQPDIFSAIECGTLTWETLGKSL